MGKGRVSWEEIRPAAHAYFEFWPDGEDFIWAKCCWAAVEKSGLTIFDTDDEKLICSSYIGLLAILYTELCTPFDDSYHPLSEHLWRDVMGYDEIDILEKRMDKLKDSLIENIGEMDFYRLTLVSIFSGGRSIWKFLELRNPIRLISSIRLCRSLPS